MEILNSSKISSEIWMVLMKEVNFEGGKGKVVPVLFLTEHHTLKVYWGSGGIAPLIL
jgi:hypothetical protein